MAPCYHICIGKDKFMKSTIITLFSLLSLAAFAGAADKSAINAISAEDIRASMRAIASEVPAPKKVALSQTENEQLYLAGTAERTRIAKEAGQYVKAEKDRASLTNAFVSPAPAGINNPAEYEALGQKNEAFIRNVGYWQEQIKGNSSNLSGALRANDLATADILINYMRHDHWAIVNETAAIMENNRKAAAWPMKQTNDQLYTAGAGERAKILAQAAVYADLTGRDMPKNAFESTTPAGTADAAKYEELRSKNAGFIGNIEYWRNQLEGNYGNLKDAVKANDLETARILLNYIKKDSADLYNEIKAVELNNAEADKL